MDWTLHYGKGVTEQQIVGTQKVSQQDASASSNEAAAIHTPPNPSGYTNPSSRVEARRGNHYETR